MLSVAELQKVLFPHNPRFSRVVWPVWDHYGEVEEGHRLAYDQRTEANILNSYMVENAKREFSDIPGVQFLEQYGGFLLGIEAFPVGLPGQVICRFKRTTPVGKSRNFPTSRACALRKNDQSTLELEGMPEATVVDIGYVLNPMRTAICTVHAIRLFDEAYIMSIPREHVGTIVAPQNLPSTQPGPRFKVTAREEKGETGNGKQK